MSISIIGANGKELSIIIEDKLLNKFNDIELEYNLLKDKYLKKCNSMIINKIHYTHFLNQLIRLFNPDETGINKFIDFIHNIQKVNNISNLYTHVKEMIKKNNILLNLNNIILNIKTKLQLPNTKKTYNLYDEINIILKICASQSKKNKDNKENKEINESIEYIKKDNK